MNVKSFTDVEAMSAAAADEIAALVHEAVSARGACRIAVAGGKTPIPVYARLATMPLPWDRLDVWFGDERCVPPENLDSNYHMMKVALLDVIGTNTIERVHRIRAEGDPAEAAAAYERELIGVLGTPPVLDIVLLGLGTDGHTASLFPHSPALGETRWVAANPYRDSMRITLTPPTLRGARHIRFLVAGADKANIVETVIDGPRDPARYPAQLMAHAETDVVWFTDLAAASQLARPT
jgi:6-phosphogluconolactonase